MADDELRELLDQLEKQTDPSDVSVERARESLEATLSSLKLTPEEETALAVELGQLRDLGTEARRNHHRDRRVRHGEPGQVVGA